MNLTKDRWIEVEIILDEALNRPPDKREAYLDKACRDDFALRRDVEAILQAENEVPTFLEGQALHNHPAFQAFAYMVVSTQAWDQLWRSYPTQSKSTLLPLMPLDQGDLSPWAPFQQIVRKARVGSLQISVYICQRSQ